MLLDTSVIITPIFLMIEMILGKVIVPRRQFLINIMISLGYVSYTFISQYSRFSIKDSKSDNEYFPIYPSNVNWYCKDNYSIIIDEKYFII